MTRVAAIAWGALFVRLTTAAQPEAPSPVEAPMRDLQWGKLNFLHTTDTHGWHGGHLQEPQYSADWGDYISFASHLRKRADNEGADLLLVDTGDRVEGNGLYDSSNPQGFYTYDIFREQHIDLICTGNHELYVYETAAREHSKMVPNFSGKYIASNLDYIDPETGEQIPMAQRYKRFRTPNQSIEIVAFGFLFDFTGNSNNTVVQPVEQTVQEEWFLDATSPDNQPDLFVVIGHVGVRMEEFHAIHRAIRKRNYLTPIAFFGGHRHVRDSVSYDPRAFALASGRYFETVGFMSIHGLEPYTGSLPAEQGREISFHRRYIDNNLWGFHYHTGLNSTTFPIPLGEEISSSITAARKDLDLDHTFGCAPTNLWMTRRSIDSKESIYNWITHRVIPESIVNEKRADKPHLVIMNTGAIRFDIFKGPFTTDSTYIVSPFKSGMKYIPDVPYRVAKMVLPLLNRGGPIFQQGFDTSTIEGDRVRDPKYMGIPQQWDDDFEERLLSVGTEEERVTPRVQNNEQLQQIPLHQAAESGDDGDKESGPQLISGYTTNDDISHDGDDTVHKPMNFYAVPNCVQAEVNIPSRYLENQDEDEGEVQVEGEEERQQQQVVDMVYMDFVEPWVLMALNFAGMGTVKYGKGDAMQYAAGTFTEAMVRWIEENWEC